MERLTHKNYIEEYEVNFEKSSDKNWSIAESDTHIKVAGEPIDKLGELEDVLEKYGIENAEELDRLINQLELSQKENQQLKQQLDEKEQENERLKEEICRYEITLMDKNSQLKKQNQDKILFAVEQLEKVKGLIANHTQELWTCENDDIDVVLYEEIDNQIKELKGKVETKLTHQYEDEGE